MIKIITTDMDNNMTKLIKRMLFSMGMVLASTSLSAQREMKTINDGWDFRLEAQQKWQQVNIPHTFNLDAYDGREYYQGKAVYRKYLALHDIDKDKNYYLKIDAASKAAQVSVNGKLVGTHNGGYSAFIMDITDYVEPRNEIEIVVDNSRNDITPIWADFTFRGGIYRDAWIVTTRKQHFNMANHGSTGVFVETPLVSAEKGVIRVRAEVANDAGEKVKMKIENRVYDCYGKLVETKQQPLALNANENGTVVYESGVIDNPLLWTPESPNLYRVVTSIKNARTGEEIDRTSNKIGFRWFSFDAGKGFFLNGKPYKLRGVNRHQDQAPSGWPSTMRRTGAI